MINVPEVNDIVAAPNSLVHQALASDPGHRPGCEGRLLHIHTRFCVFYMCVCARESLCEWNLYSVSPSVADDSITRHCCTVQQMIRQQQPAFTRLSGASRGWRGQDPGPTGCQTVPHTALLQLRQDSGVTHSQFKGRAAG